MLRDANDQDIRLARGGAACVGTERAYDDGVLPAAGPLLWRGESGVKLSAATLCQTIAKLADAAGPVVRCLAHAMWRGGYVQLDLTPVRCLSREHAGGSFLEQMWVAAVPGGDVLYTWGRSKEALVAERSCLRRASIPATIMQWLFARLPDHAERSSLASM